MILATATACRTQRVVSRTPEQVPFRFHICIVALDYNTDNLSSRQAKPLNSNDPKGQRAWKS